MLIPDHNVVVQNHRVVGLNETHAAHICSKVVDFIDALAHLHACVQIAQIYLVVLIAYFVIIEVVSMLPVRNTNEVTFSLEALGDVTANEATTTSDENTKFSCHLLEMNLHNNQTPFVFGFGPKELRCRVGRTWWRAWAAIWRKSDKRAIYFNY